MSDYLVSDHCDALSISQWLFDFSCSKIDSFTGLFPSRKGKARDIIRENIDSAIKNEKVADYHHIKTSKPKYGRMSDISRYNQNLLIPSHTVLYCIILYHTISYRTILFCTIYHATLYCTIPSHTSFSMLHHAIL